MPAQVTATQRRDMYRARFTRQALDALAALFAAHGRLTYETVSDELGWTRDKTAIAFHLFAVACSRRVRLRKMFRLRPDAAQRMAAHLISNPPLTIRREPGLPTWPTGAPHHFDTDHLGRVLYRGAA